MQVYRLLPTALLFSKPFSDMAECSSRNQQFRVQALVGPLVFSTPFKFTLTHKYQKWSGVLTPSIYPETYEYQERCKYEKVSVHFLHS